MAKESNTPKDELTLTPYDENDNAVSQAPLEQYDYVPTSEDMRVPRIRLAQGLTPEVLEQEARAGEWLAPHEKPAKEIDVVILGLRRSRTYRVGGDDDDESYVSCQSVDGEIGVGDPGGVCAECPMAEWASGENGRRIPPPCDLAYHYLVAYGNKYSNYAELVMRGTQKTTAQQVNALYRQGGPGRTFIKLGSAMNRRGQRSWYVPTVEKYEQLKTSVLDKKES